MDPLREQVPIGGEWTMAGVTSTEVARRPAGSNRPKAQRPLVVGGSNPTREPAPKLPATPTFGVHVNHGSVQQRSS